jgi:hypothetical protein
VLSAFFSRSIGTVYGKPVEQYPILEFFGVWILAGLLIAVLVHAGITIVSWMMARAIGGPGQLPYLYRATAYLLPLSTPALPLVALSIAAAGQDAKVQPLPLESLYLPLAAIGLALVFAGLYQIYLLTQDKGPKRSAVAVALFALFCGSVLMII